MSVRRFPAAFLVLAGVVAGCKSEKPPAEAAAPPAPSPTVVTITASDYALALPAQIPAGAVTMHLVNQGKELHQAQVIRLEEGKTVADFAEAMKHKGPPPTWIKFQGGPNAVVPGGETEITTVLPPGSYAVLCFIPSADGVPHVMKGMVQPFEVTAATGTDAAELPVADDTINLADYSFQSGHPITAGRHAFLVENTGPQLHEIVLIRLAPGKSLAEFSVWAMAGMKGPPPGEPLGGVVGMDIGGKTVWTADLTPGDYGFICFVEDAKDGKPHFAHGMLTQFKVS